MVSILLGRAAETKALDRLLADVREGRSSVLVVRGEAGIGKSTLLEHAVTVAADMDVVRTVGIESEMELSFAGLHQMLSPFLNRLGRLPDPQREALRSAFGLITAPTPNLFLVGLAALTLLADAAGERPLLCVIDDAQWLDRASAQALGFVARRLLADRVAMLFAVRDESGRADVLDGLSELRVEGMPPSAAHELLASAVSGPLAPSVSDRIVTEARGNPLALTEIGGELSAEELSGAEPLREPLPIGRRLEERFLARVRSLPASSQALLLLAAADRLSDPALLWRAAEHLGIGSEAADPPGLGRLLAIEPKVAFRHPLMRSAVYQGAAPRERRRAHLALAAVIDPRHDPDRRAWHRAQAAVAPDEEIAAELDLAAGRAADRGGPVEQAAFLERAAELSADGTARYRRLVGAARAQYLAGAPGRALELLSRGAAARGGLRDEAQEMWLRGHLTFFVGDPSEGAPLIVRAAQALAPVDLPAARATMLDALGVAGWVGASALSDTALAAQQLARVPDSQATPDDLLMDSLATLVLGDWPTAAPLFRRGIAGLPSGTEDLPYMAFCMAMYLCDLEGWYALLRSATESMRDTGELAVFSHSLDQMAVLECYRGRFGRAQACLVEARDVLAAINAPDAMATARGELVLLGHQGREAEARDAAAALLQMSSERGLGLLDDFAQAGLCTLELGLGNYRAALAAAQAVFATDHVDYGIKILPDLVEAASRLGENEAAAAGMKRLRERARASGAPWALGLLARTEALLAPDGQDGPLFSAALAQLTSAGAVFDVARTHLLYGERLRRERSRVAARTQLRAAYQRFEAMGADAFAERARMELLAAGEQVSGRSVPAGVELTPQEDRIARLASGGASNRQIAAKLFLSPATVDYHLRKVFRKLEISRRAQLAGKLPAA